MTKWLCVALVTVVIALSSSYPGYARSTNANGGAAAAHGGAGHWSGSPHGHWAGGHHGFHGHHGGVILADPFWWGADPFGYWPSPPVIAQQRRRSTSSDIRQALAITARARVRIPRVSSCAEPWVRVAPERL